MRLPVRQGRPAAGRSHRFHRFDAPRSLAVLILSLGLLTVFSRGVRADIQEPPDAHAKGERQVQRKGQTPPSAVPQTLEIQQGDRVEITLQAHGSALGTMEFLIRTNPEHGALEGPPRQITRDTASVVYVHRAADGPGTDTFSFAVQARGSGVSAPVNVDIGIADTAPNVASTPGELDFGAVNVGDSTGASVTLENTGGGVAAGRLDLPRPWQLDGPADYRLRHGETRSFHITFAPQTGRAFAETIHFGNDDGHGVRIVGTGIGAPGMLATDAPDQPDRKDATGRTVGANAGTGAGAGGLATGPGGSVGGVNGGTISVGPESTRKAGVLGGAGGAGAPGGSVGTGRPSQQPLVAASGAGSPGGSGSPGVSSSTAGAILPDVDNGPVGRAIHVPGSNDPGTVYVNQAHVATVGLRGVGTNTIDLSWKPPVPTPANYRVEFRYLTFDESAPNNLRIDWRPYAQIEIHLAPGLVTAALRGLPAGTRQTLRVVAVNDSGQLSAPSATLTVETRLPSTWWHLTPLKVLIGLLVICLGLIARRKWEERQILREIEESRRAAPEKSLTLRR